MTEEVEGRFLGRQHGVIFHCSTDYDLPCGSFTFGRNLPHNIKVYSLLFMSWALFSAMRWLRNGQEVDRISDEFFPLIRRSLAKRYIFKEAEIPVGQSRDIDWLNDAVYHPTYNRSLVMLRLNKGEKAVFNVVAKNDEAFLKPIPYCSDGESDKTILTSITRSSLNLSS